MPRAVLVLTACAVILLSASQCRFPDPTADDVERVKQEFLMLRFHAPTIREFSHMSDMELFQKSCQSKRVRCDKVLQIIKDKDPDFYQKLTGGGTSVKEGKL
ncbi:MAG: hypothetical protein HY042_07365 [Spirochaetia bacterium]|nr:hypothetical protein [Spirochaetia bacterium]